MRVKSNRKLCLRCAEELADALGVDLALMWRLFIPRLARTLILDG